MNGGQEMKKEHLLKAISWIVELKAMRLGTHVEYTSRTNKL